MADTDRALVTLVRRMLDDGLKVSEVCQALDLSEDEVRQLRHWHPASKFTKAESARYRDLLRYASWRLPYWTRSSDGRMELLPEEARSLRKMEVAARYRSRVEHGKVPPELVDKPQVTDLDL